LTDILQKGRQNAIIFKWPKWRGYTYFIYWTASTSFKMANVLRDQGVQKEIEYAYTCQWFQN
jgi:hypothetical protein